MQRSALIARQQRAIGPDGREMLARFVAHPRADGDIAGLDQSAERDARLAEMSGRYLYFRPGDAPALDFETVDP